MTYIQAQDRLLNVLISSEIGSWGWTLSVHPKLVECMAICFEPGLWIWSKGVPTFICILWGKKIRKFFSVFFLFFFFILFFLIFFFFWAGEAFRHIIYRKYIVFRGLSIFCCLATHCFCSYIWPPLTKWPSLVFPFPRDKNVHPFLLQRPIPPSPTPTTPNSPHPPTP